VEEEGEEGGALLRLRRRREGRRGRGVGKERSESGRTLGI